MLYVVMVIDINVVMVIDIREMLDYLVLLDLMVHMVNKYVTMVMQHVVIVTCTHRGKMVKQGLMDFKVSLDKELVTRSHDLVNFTCVIRVTPADRVSEELVDNEYVYNCVVMDTILTILG